MILHNIAVINFQSEDMIAVSKKKHIDRCVVQGDFAGFLGPRSATTPWKNGAETAEA